MNTQPQEKDWAGTILYFQKMEAKLLCSTALESTNDSVRNFATRTLNQCLQDQKNLYDMMSKKGWYKVEAAPREELSRIQQSFSTMQSQMQ